MTLQALASANMYNILITHQTDIQSQGKGNRVNHTKLFHNFSFSVSPEMLRNAVQAFCTVADLL